MVSHSTQAQPAEVHRDESGDLADGCTRERFILLDTSVTLARELADEVATDLATELDRRGLGLCLHAVAAREPAAVVALNARDDTVFIELDDRTTAKRVARDIRVDRVPPNGQALAIAIAVDELLRASWAELELEPRDEPVTAPPVPSPARLPAPSPRVPPRRAAVGLAFGKVHTGAAYEGFSLSLLGEMYPFEWGWAQLNLGGTRALPVQAPLGEVSGQGLLAAATLGACAPLHERVRACGGARTALDLLWFSGDAASGARGRKGSAWVVRLEGVFSLSLSLRSRGILSGQLGLGAPLRGVHVTDGDETFVGVRGVVVSGQLWGGVQL